MGGLAACFQVFFPVVSTSPSGLWSHMKTVTLSKPRANQLVSPELTAYVELCQEPMLINMGILAHAWHCQRER